MPEAQMHCLLLSFKFHSHVIMIIYLDQAVNTPYLYFYLVQFSFSNYIKFCRCLVCIKLLENL